MHMSLMRRGYVYTGDELYPASPDLNGASAPAAVEKTVAEMNVARTLNRSYRDTSGIQMTLSNVAAQCGLVPPVTLTTPSHI